MREGVRSRPLTRADFILPGTALSRRPRPSQCASSLSLMSPSRAGLSITLSAHPSLIDDAAVIAWLQQRHA